MKSTNGKNNFNSGRILTSFTILTCGFFACTFAAEPISNSNSDYLWQISKSHLKDPLVWSTIWRVTPQADDPASMQGFNRVTPEATHGEEKSNAKAKPQAQNDWRKNEEKRTKNYLAKVGPLQPSTYQKMPAEDSSPIASNTNPSAPIKHYLAQSIVLTTPFLAESEGPDGYYPGETKLKYNSSNESQVLQPFEEVTLGSGENKNVKTGDLFRVYEVGENYESPHTGASLGRLVTTTGVVEILRVGQKTSVGRLIKCFSTISRHARACPLEKSPEIVATGYSPVMDGKLAAQVAWVTEQQFPQPFSYTIIDKGSDKGFKIGDMVLFFNSVEGKMTDKVLGNGLIVDIKAKSATILIKDIYPGIINRGDYTVVIQSPVM